jgi:hypothetical protein
MIEKVKMNRYAWMPIARDISAFGTLIDQFFGLSRIRYKRGSGLDFTGFEQHPCCQ